MPVIIFIGYGLVFYKLIVRCVNLIANYVYVTFYDLRLIFRWFLLVFAYRFGCFRIDGESKLQNYRCGKSVADFIWFTQFDWVTNAISAAISIFVQYENLVMKWIQIGKWFIRYFYEALMNTRYSGNVFLLLQYILLDSTSVKVVEHLKSFFFKTNLLASYNVGFSELRFKENYSITYNRQPKPKHKKIFLRWSSCTLSSIMPQSTVVLIVSGKVFHISLLKWIN